ncbi:MAG TPA: inositol-3-phosphate synthase [Phycisphaerae bacterium]|nr:inositol-3-phosphate synthase [Phycisphaerae bacterium]
MREVRLAIVGVGNCASTLIQGLTFYRRTGSIVGLMHPQIGGLKIGDIRIACAFDVDRRKIGQSVSKAVFAPPNNSRVFCSDPEDDGARVYAGPVSDAVAEHLEQFDENRRVSVDSAAGKITPAEVVRRLTESGATVLVNYLPVGSQKATEIYAQACLDARIAMVNCMPVFIASDATWAAKFRESGLPLIGDDVKSQFGATIIHRQLMALAQSRGISIDSSYQLNVGGNTDFLNMLQRDRLGSKKVSKTEAVTSQISGGIAEDKIHIGPSDYIPFLADNKVCYIRVNARGFGGLPMELDLKLSVEDSPNSAGIVVDAVRCAALALRAGIGGPLEDVCAALMKHPPVQKSDDVAASAVDQWIKQYEASHR